uniref:Crossover junction endonuclease MUS81 n=1 Tax=Albugo laibachii Nc14 TaxID=890382 RepID=F0WEQ6_9STRA|nr:crossover junction endonuclease MUS81like protein pu [Albugo laibachii Nc14]|eukprot:CCA19688.1 crossover junction endonuclease MUS81like protein pu [Albugo laibachii Nc14]
MRKRFAEQKQRLQACGLNHVVYLVEGSMSQQTTVMKGGLEDALCLTEFRDDFLVHMSQNADDTVAYLSAIHRRLLARFPRAQCLNPELAALCPSRFLSSVSTSFATLFATPPISFAEFNRKFQKRANFSASEMYQRMLTQIPSLSTAKIAAIVHHHKTFDQLIASMQSIDQLDQEKDASVSRLCQIRYGEKNQLLDARTRNIIRILFQSDDYNVS